MKKYRQSSMFEGKGGAEALRESGKKSLIASIKSFSKAKSKAIAKAKK